MKRFQPFSFLLASVLVAGLPCDARPDTTTDELIAALGKYERRLSNLELRIQPWPGRKTCWTSRNLDKVVIQTVENRAKLLSEWHVEFDPPVSVMGKAGEGLPVSVAVDQRGIAVGEFGFFLGVCYLDQRRFTTLIREPGSVLSTELDVKEGPQVAKLVASVPKHGVYEFWFDKTRALQLSRFRFTKKVGDVVYDANGSVAVGSPDSERDPSGGRTGPFTKTMMLVGDFGPIEYNDDGLQKGVNCKLFRQQIGGALRVDHEVKYDLEIVGPCEVPMTQGRTQFIHPDLRPLENSTNVVLFKRTGLRYDLRGGRLIPVNDQDARDILNETRIRPPSGYRSPLFYAFMSLGVIAIVSWLLLRSRR